MALHEVLGYYIEIFFWSKPSSMPLVMAGDQPFGDRCAGKWVDKRSNRHLVQRKKDDMIDILPEPGKRAWNEYATEKNGSKFSHLFEWAECLAKTYRLPVFRLASINSGTGRVTGILPLLFFAPPGGVKRLISLPYTDSAGITADDEESCRRLLAAALQLAEEHGVDHVELRQSGPLLASLQQKGADALWESTPYDFKTGLCRPLPRNADALWLDLSAKVRNQIRKARRCGCMSRVGGAELLGDFYAVFSENMRDLGSPVHSYQLFQNIADSRSIRTAIMVISLDGEPAAGAMVFLHNGTLCNPWASSLRRYRPCCPNMLLYWSMLEYAVESRCRWFDFGRSSPDASTCRFKLQWGAEKVPLVWQVFSRKLQGWDPRSESLELASWKTLDLADSRRDGPALRRWISL